LTSNETRTPDIREAVSAAPFRDLQNIPYPGILLNRNFKL
jgi:hypothetical protein